MINIKNIVLQESDRLFGVYGNKFKQDKKEIVEFGTLICETFVARKTNRVDFLEIGTCFGATFNFIGNILSACKLDVYGASIDLPNIKLWGGHNIELFKEIRKGLPKFTYDLTTGDSHDPDIVNHFSESQFDLLFIDGDHSENGCWQDFQNYGKLVRPDGLIAIHDITYYSEWPHVEVYKVWAKLKTQHKTISIAYAKSYGIGVIFNAGNKD